MYYTKYIKYLDTSLEVDPYRFGSYNEYVDQCNIMCILHFDFLDMQLTEILCSERWKEYLEELRYICYE